MTGKVGREPRAVSHRLCERRAQESVAVTKCCCRKVKNMVTENRGSDEAYQELLAWDKGLMRMGSRGNCGRKTGDGEYRLQADNAVCAPDLHMNQVRGQPQKQAERPTAGAHMQPVVNRWGELMQAS